MKKNLFKYLLAICFALLALVVVSPQAQAASFTMNSTSTTITVGKSVNMKIDGVSSSKAKWKSSKKSVAKVSSKGKVTGKKAGTATITATYNGLKFKCKVTVEPKKYTYNKQIYKDSNVKIKLKYTAKNTIVFSVTNRTNSMIAFNCEYVKLDGKEYTYEGTEYGNPINIAGKDTREYRFCENGDGIIPVPKPNAKKISGLFLYCNDSFYEYATVTSTSLK